MADNFTVSTASGPRVIRSVDNGGVHTQAELASFMSGGAPALVADNSPLPVSVAPADVNGGYAIVGKTARFTTTQNGTLLWAPTAGKRLFITKAFVSVGGSTSGDLTVWWSTTSSSDTVFTVGTDWAILDGAYAVSNSSKENHQFDGIFPAPYADYPLRITTSANMTVKIVLWGYEK